MARPPKQKPISVYLYIPNIIGYIRVIMNCVAFALCYSNKTLFAILYFISFVCDGLDGWFARKFNQVSTFGAVLDMVTDRVSTACLLAVLSQLYRPGLIFLALLGLDIASHWFQMYSTFLSGKSSHKDVKDSSNWLFKAYYGNRKFMAFCCVGSEVLYIILYLLADEKSESLLDVCLNALGQKLPLSLFFLLNSIGWAIKQVVNVIQMKYAADSCVYHDMKKKSYDPLSSCLTEWDVSNGSHVSKASDLSSTRHASGSCQHLEMKRKIEKYLCTIIWKRTQMGSYRIQ